MNNSDTTAQHIPSVEVRVQGALDVWSAPEVNATIDEAMALHPRQLIIDLAECPSIDAAGILLLLDAHRRAIGAASP
jgi:anti-sigma B factor antagonist